MAKKITLYGILAALALIFGYIESLFSLSFIAPGIKLGLANSLCLILISTGDTKGAFCVNTVRILLSSLLFSTPFALLFSLTAGLASTLTAGLASTLAAAGVSKFKSVSSVGTGIAGAAVHNTVQICVAALIFGGSVFYYLPVLLVSAVVTGGAVGAISECILKKIKTKLK